MLRQHEVNSLVDRLVARCGPDLVVYAEHMRHMAHVDGENARDDEGRVRAQAVAVVYRELAQVFSGARAAVAEEAINRDRAAIG